MAREMEQQQQQTDGLREKMIAVNAISACLLFGMFTPAIRAIPTPKFRFT
jgi:hypothetical protein